MKNYELLYIIPSSYTDEEMGKIETKVGSILTKFNATALATRRLGKMRLTYPIRHQRHGLYVMVSFSAEPPMVAKIEDMLRITPEVLRALVTLDEHEGEQKFDLVQFTEVVIEAREDRRRQERTDKEKKEEKAEVKEDKPEAPAASMSAEDLDKKIDSALQEHTKTA